MPQEYSFPDNWIYIHDPGVKVGRVQNFGSWSPFMVKEGRTCLGLEFFVNEGDDMWTKSDDDLVEQGKRELEQLGLIDDVAKVEAGYVVRMPKAYPVYDEHYQAHVDDHAQVDRGEHARTCSRAAVTACTSTTTRTTRCSRRCSRSRTSLGAHHDVWTVNVEAEYHEHTSDGHTSATGRERPAAATALARRLTRTEVREVGGPRETTAASSTGRRPTASR